MIKCLDQSLGLFIVTAAAPFVFPLCDLGIERIPGDLHITSVVIVTKFYFPKMAAVQEKTLACVKVAFRQKTINILTNK